MKFAVKIVRENMAEKLVFLIADSDSKLANEIAGLLRSTYLDSQVYVAHEGSDALKKIRNVPPSLLITGLDLGTKFTGTDLCRTLSQERAHADLPILVLSDLTDQMPGFSQELNRGRMKFVSMPLEKDAFLAAVANILASASMKDNLFQTVVLKAGEVLFREGEKADRAFLVKSGKLQASRAVNGQLVVLGEMVPGEFVGEMAHITEEPRGADVKALVDTELVEIPCGTLDQLIFSKPTWTKALLKTLCRRLREANLKHS